jgi:hypothetical protein
MFCRDLTFIKKIITTINMSSSGRERINYVIYSMKNITTVPLTKTYYRIFFYCFFFFFFFLSFRLYYGWYHYMWNCCKTCILLLYECQPMFFWRLAYSFVVEVLSRLYPANSSRLIICPIHECRLYFLNFTG